MRGRLRTPGPRPIRGAPVAAGLVAAAAAAAALAACGGSDGSTAGEADPPAAEADRSASSRAPERFGFGRPASSEEIARWDVDVGPDGNGLPPGEGSVQEGAEVYERACARCHGPTGTEGPYDVLVRPEPRDSFPFGRRPELTSTIGNYWPYATTVFDYVRRTMPFDDPGSLDDDEVYAVTAWLLWRNELVDEDAVMNAETLPAVEMPAKEHFVPSEDVNLQALP